MVTPTSNGAEARRAENLYKLVYEIHGGPTDFFEKFKYPTTSYLAQMIGPKKSRPVSEKVARKVESVARLPEGWLDQTHREPDNAAPEVNSNDVFRLIATLGEICKAENVTFEPTRQADVVAFAYEAQLSDKNITRLVRLLKKN